MAPGSATKSATKTQGSWMAGQDHALSIHSNEVGLKANLEEPRKSLGQRLVRQGRHTTSMVDIPEDGPPVNWMIPSSKNSFGITGYELPKPANLDCKNKDIINWTNALNR